MMKNPIKSKSVCIALAAAMFAGSFLTACAGSPIKKTTGTGAKNEETKNKVSHDISFDDVSDRKRAENL